MTTTNILGIKSSSNSNINIRLATFQDVPHLADVGVQAGTKEQPIHDFIFPWRAKYPGDYRGMWARQLKLDMRKDLLWVICAETSAPCPKSYDEDNNDSAPLLPTKQIAGWAIWTRATPDDQTTRTIHNLEQTLNLRARYRYASLVSRLWYTTVLYLESTYIMHVVRALLNRATNTRNYMHINSASADSFDGPGFQETENHWYLEELYVRPDCQRQGVGQKLLDWGLGAAKIEKLPALLCSSPAGRRLYEKNGFVKYGEWRWRVGRDREGDSTWPKMRLEPEVGVVNERDICSVSL